MTVEDYGRCHKCGASDHQASAHPPLWNNAPLSDVGASGVPPVPPEFTTACAQLLERFEAAAAALTKALTELAPVVQRLSKDLDRAVDAGRDARGE